MKLSIIIVNYNVKYFLEQCLCSVGKAIKNIDAEILVVDNGSADNSVAYLSAQFSQVKFIVNDSNLGFAKANNKALMQCNGNYVLFLNPDTILPEDVLINCLNFLDTGPGAGVVGVRMIDGSGAFLPESKRSFPSPVVSFYKLTGLSAAFPKSRLFNRYALGYLDEHSVHEADVISGAFMMASRKILLNLNGFDEDFFMYGEDIDLSYRIQKAGHKNFYLGTETIIHFKGESTKSERLKYLGVFYNAMHIFVRKHYTDSLFFALFLQIGIVIRWLFAAIWLPFSRLYHFIKSNIITKHIPVMLTGDEVSVKEVKAILAGNSIPFREIPFSHIVSNKNIAGEIIFCTGELSYKETIECIQDTKKKSYFKWHGINSQSIAGSTSKNKQRAVFYITYKDFK